MRATSAANCAEVRWAGVRAPANTSSTTRSTEAGRGRGERGARVADRDVDAQPVGGQPVGDELGERAVELHDGLGRAGAGRGHVAGQRPRAAAEVQRAQRRVGRRAEVDQVTDPPDVLELQVRRVVEVDVALRRAVHEQRPAVRPVRVADELGRRRARPRRG